MMTGIIIERSFISKEEHNALEPDAYGIGKGRMFGSWIDSNGRSNGYAEGDLIENPAYIIESILREELRNEYYKQNFYNLLEDYEWTGNYEEYPDGTHYIGGTSLNETAVTFPVVSGVTYILKYNVVVISEAYTILLKNSSIDFHQLFGGTSTPGVKTILFTAEDDYSTIEFGAGSIGTYEINNITIEEHPAIYNVPINTDSFDVVGNTTNGSHKDWKCAKSIYSQMGMSDLLNLICYECHLILTKSYNEFTLKPLLLQSNIVGTFQFFIAQKGIIKFNLEYTPIDNIYTEFTLNYHYDYGSSTYKKKIKVTPLYSSDSSLDSYKSILKANETNYRLSRKWEYNADYIYDDATALLCIENFIKQHISQRIIINFVGDIQNHIKYEIGDQVLVYLPSLLPDTINYSKVFMIFSKKININSSTVEFGLIELADQPTEANLITEDNNNLVTQDSNQLITEQVWLT